MATTPTNNPVPSESPIDLKYNAGKIDEFVTSFAEWYVDRFGNKHYTIEGLKKLALQQIYNLGWNPVGTFQGGAQLKEAGDIIQDTSTSIWYRWDDLSSLPKSVPAGSTPDSTGGTGDGKWQAVDVTDVLRKDLAKITGASQVGAVDTDGSKTTVQEFLSATDSAKYRSKNIAKLSQIDYLVRNRGSLSALFQGDSMTAGFDNTSTDSVDPENGDWARHASTTYPERFVYYIKEQSGCTVTPIYRARSGFTARQAYEYEEWQENPNCDIAFLMYGINDANGVDGATHESYLIYMEKLIRRFIDWGMGVVVLSCANGGYGSRDQLAQAYSMQIKNLSTIYGCAFYNANASQFNRQFAAVQSDIGHFNSNGYARLGDELASMVMAGGLMPHYRPVSSEITFWPGAVIDQVGYCNPQNNININRFPDAAFTLQKISGGFPTNAFSVMSYSFYLDAEAAEVDVIGSWASNSLLSFISQQGTSSQQGPNVTYYLPGTYSSNLSENVNGMLGGLTINNSTTASGAPKHLGTLSGRGWKTITIYTPQDGSGAGSAFIQGVTLRPIPRYLASKTSPGTLRRGVKEAVMLSLPPRDSSPSAGIPPAVSLSTITMPLPFDMYPLAFNNSSNYFDCGSAKVVITGTVGGSAVYYEAVLLKSATGTGYSVTELHKVGTWGSLSATVGIKTKKILIAKDSMSTGMPIENIYTIGDDSSFTANAVPNEYGLFLRLSFSWAGSAPTGYYNICLESFARGLGGAAPLSII